MCVVGEFGSGKSSLLQAITGSMLSTESENDGKIKISGKVALVEQ